MFPRTLRTLVAVWRQFCIAQIAVLRGRFHGRRGGRTGFQSLQFLSEISDKSNETRVLRRRATPSAQTLHFVVQTQLRNPSEIAVLQAQFWLQGPFTPAGSGPAGLPAQQPLGRQHQHAGRKIQLRIEVKLQPT
ncbi:MAG: hypothetical protein ACO1OR_14680 [Hydrogenophaga sp.]|uniref:hypothetical protein n=1 Tax=Hydrogenophaga intermedia TaxID=65786 RepID=UPI003EB7DE16